MRGQGALRRVARQRAGRRRAVRLAVQRGEPLSAALLDEVAHGLLGRPLGLSESFIAGSVDPARIVASRSATGGAAEPAVRAMIEELAAVAATYQGWLAGHRQRLPLDAPV